MAKSLYQILGVAPDADTEALRAAHARLSERVPPLDAVQRLAVNEAFATLSHPRRRAAYDAALHGAAAAATEAEAAPAKTLPLRWIGAGVLLLAAGAWWAMRPAAPRAPAAPQVVSTVVTSVEAAPPGAQPATPAAPAARPLGGEQLFAQASASIVRVNALGPGGEPLAFGSGVVVDAGSVITNCHVVRRGAALSVRHGRDAFDASVALADEAHDLCRLAVPGLAAPPVRIGSVAGLRVGQKVYAIGSPQGLDLTLSDGMVSSLREGPDGTFVQTTAPISPGSSGGGLFDESGTLVGIVTFQMKAGQNLNFALPADWIGTMSATAARESPPAEAPVTLAPPADAPGAALRGRWACFGPLTGRGIDVVLEADGSVSGTFDGKPVRGRWALQGRQLFFIDAPFAIEELTPQRLVLAQGQGRRLVCNR